ncbi:hypothetical protein C2S51_008453 [Perilla frutescens var. frutescens]|nr:hypothetical protein C2S51_008453 [Perilla frutescens var. frutescens]
MNSTDIDPYIKEHMAYVSSKFPTKAKSKKWLQDQHNKYFIGWLRDHVGTASTSSNEQLSKRLKRLAYGPRTQVLKYASYMIDGVTFHTKKRDETRVVQNSGVSLVASTMQLASAKDKNLVVEDMVFYEVIEEIRELDYNAFRIVVFKCAWMDNKNGIVEVMAGNDSDESMLASKDTQSSKSTMGKICLTGLAKCRAKGIINEVEFNTYGQPESKVASEMQSYIGVLAREHVKVSYKTWRDVPMEVKDLIWEQVTLAYKFDEKWRFGCLESASGKWRQWKSRLYSDHILPNKDDPTKLHEPPQDSGIQVADWSQFVLTRLSDDFKKLSELQKDRRKKNICPHRLSRRDYAGLAESMDEYISQKEDGVFKSKGPTEDLLTTALETPEHYGRVRDVGAYVHPDAYFKYPKEKKRSQYDVKILELESAKKRIFDRLGKLEATVSAKDKFYEEKGSCTAKNQDTGDDDECEEDVVLLDKEAALKGKSVALTLKSNKDVVAYGTVVCLYGEAGTLHGAPIPKGCACVSIHEALDENAMLPFPIPNVSALVGNAIGSHVAWPTKLLVVKDEIAKREKIEQKVTFKERKSKSYASLPASLKVLYCYDILPFCDLDPIFGNCVVAYIGHLYGKLEEQNHLARFTFVNPFSISYVPGSDRDERARCLADRLANVSTKQLVLVPCNVGQHWILTIIEPHNEKVYLMDPLAHRNRDDCWKYIVDMAINMFNANKGKKAKKQHNWEIIKFQKKPYSKDEINEVRVEWASFVSDHL